MKKIFYAIIFCSGFFCAEQTYAQSKYALSFNGTNQHVLCGNRSDMAFIGTSAFTLEAWIKITGSGFRTILSKYNAGIGGSYILGVDNSNKLYLGRGASPTTTTSLASIPVDVFTHIAASYDGSNVTLYINGQLDITSTSSAPSTATGVDVVVAGNYISNTLSNYFSGTIDEIKVWNNARTQAEIIANMLKETRVSSPGLVAYYTCNNGTGTTLTDLKTGPNGTLQNSPAWVASGANISETCFYGNALHFDGIVDHEVNVGPQPLLDFSNASFTLQARVYPTGPGSNGSQGIIISNEGRYQIGRDANNELFVNLYTTGFGYGDDIRTILYLPQDEWTEVTVVYDHISGTLLAYVDGGETSLNEIGNPRRYARVIPGISGDLYPAENDIIIGGRQKVTHNFNGSIDEVKVWNYAKTAAQIKGEVNLPTNPAATGLLAYYRFDEGLAGGNNTGNDKLLDVSVNKFHGTLNNFALNGATSNWVSSIKYYQWAGTANSDWTNAGNWEIDAFPGSSTNIYIPAGTPNSPVITSTQSVNALIMGPNVSINLNNASFNVAGDLYKNGPFTGTGTLFLNGTIDQKIFGKGSIVNLTANNPPFFVATLYDSTVLTGQIIANTDATIWTGRYLTMKSDINGTARAGNSPGRILDSVAIERYFPNIGKRAWHLVTYSSHCHSSLFTSWQEKGTNVPGRGTLITSDLYNGSNGFDMASNSASILTYNQGDNDPPTWSYNFPTTLADGSLKQGYMLYIRGDRSYTASTPGTSATTLTHTGIFWQPYREQLPVTVKAIGPGYTLVGNPYASPIDFESIYTITNLRQNFIIWDPLLTGSHGLGGYRTVERTAGGVYQATPSLGVAQDALLRYINAGTAFFLKADGGNASVGFNQNSKSNISGPISPIVTKPGEQQLLVHLQVVQSGSTETPIIDGFRVRFDKDNEEGISDDVQKMSSFNENIASFSAGKRLIVEKRPMLKDADTVFIKLNKTGIRNYRYQITTIDFTQTNATAFLQDTYLNTNVPLNLSGADNAIDFNITSDPASASEDRFRIIFALKTPSNVSFTKLSAIQQGKDIAVEWKVSNQVNMQSYEVEKSTDGIHFEKVETKPAIGANGSDAAYNWLDVDAVLGDNYYRIRSIGSDAVVKLSRQVLVNISEGKPEISIYPNPVVDQTIHVQFNNLEKGLYQWRLINKLGQVVMAGSINHNGSGVTQKLELKKGMAKGNYQLEVNGPGNYKITKTVAIAE